MHIALGIGIGKEGALGGESPPAPGPVMDLILLGSGTNNAIVTPASLLAGTIGSLTGWSAWGRPIHNPLEHTHVRSGAFVRRTPISNGGTNYDGTGAKTIEFNLTEALVLASSPLYEGFNIIPPAGIGDITMTGLIKFGGSYDSGNTNFDTVLFYNGGYCSMQYGTRFGDANVVYLESQLSGGERNMGWQ